MNIEDEREAWMEHFKKVSEGRGHVAEHVWNNIPKRERTEPWLGKAPSDIELDLCVKKMKMGKASGKDGFMAELLKHEGDEIKQRVFKTVHEMWEKAASATEGKEGEAWPEHWKIGIVVPLWKKKGSREDKNTYRGITLFERRIKITSTSGGREIANMARKMVTRKSVWFQKRQRGR